MSNKKSQQVYNKKDKKRDITIELDKFNIGRIPTAKGNVYFKNKKYDKKLIRKKSKLNLKKYIG